MKYDKKIKSIVKTINYKSELYLDEVNYYNENAMTDRIIESIIEKSKELEKYHEKRFEISKKDREKER